MRRTVSLLALAALAACDKDPNNEHPRAMSMPAVRYEPSVPEAAEPPDIASQSAPGVAFNFRYAFRLPAERIAAMQEQHAQACEKLGPDRCRITGMRYRLVSDRDVEAMLAFKLDPMIARQFGKDGIKAVDEAKGMLVDSEISGEDVASQIATVDRSVSETREDIQRIERQLLQAGLQSEERAELRRQIQRLREALRANQASQDARRDMLATTPLVFQYGSGDLAPGFDTRPSLAQAMERAGENFTGGVSLLLVILVSLLPWGIALGLGIWLVRLILRRVGFLTAPETGG